jgi:outer membrane lipoprotein-sorting protein
MVLRRILRNGPGRRVAECSADIPVCCIADIPVGRRLACSPVCVVPDLRQVRKPAIQQTGMSALRRSCAWLVTLGFVLAAPTLPLRAAELNPQVASWLAAQTNIQSWSADFTQTRMLKSLAQPLTATGHVWFAAPNRFRWELGHPAQTIAVREPAELLLIYPRLKRVEHFPLTGSQTGPWRDALALLEAGFPRSRAQLEAQYNTLSQSVNGQLGELVLQPKSQSARRMMPELRIAFDTQTHALRATELHFADGSTMRNDFKDPVLNPKLEESLFAPQIPPDYKNVEPLKNRP